MAMLRRVPASVSIAAAFARAKMFIKECTGIGLKPLDHLDEALAMCRVRQLRNPRAQVFASIENQLHYLRDVVSETETDRGRLRNIALGQYAGAHLDDIDPPFGRALNNASRIAECLAVGCNLESLRLRRASRRPR